MRIFCFVFYLFYTNHLLFTQVKHELTINSHKNQSWFVKKGNMFDYDNIYFAMYLNGRQDDFSNKNRSNQFDLNYNYKLKNLKYSIGIGTRKTGTYCKLYRFDEHGVFSGNYIMSKLTINQVYFPLKFSYIFGNVLHFSPFIGTTININKETTNYYIIPYNERDYKSDVFNKNSNYKKAHINILMGTEIGYSIIKDKLKFGILCTYENSIRPISKEKYTENIQNILSWGVGSSYQF